MVANADDKQSFAYLILPVEHALPSHLAGTHPMPPMRMADIFILTILTSRYIFPANSRFACDRRSNGCARTRHTNKHDQNSARQLKRIPGRAERIDEAQRLRGRCDYAHTPSLSPAL